MIRSFPICRIPIQCVTLPKQVLRHSSSNSSSSSSNNQTRVLTLEAARNHGLKVLSEHDRSSYILHQYIHKQAQDAFLAIRLFNLDTARIGDTVTNKEIAKLRFDFWRRSIQEIFTVAAANGAAPLEQSSRLKGSLGQEPIAILLNHALTQQNVTLSKRFFITLLQSRETYSTMPAFRNIDAMASYGEGTFSQILYLIQEASFSVAPKVTDFLAQYPELDDLSHNLVAHIGQASGIAGLLKGFRYYGSRGSIVLPIDIMSKYNVSQHALTKLFQSLADKSIDLTSPEVVNLRKQLSDIVFETATRANDHIISASAIVKELNTALRGSIPDAIFVPALNVVPTQLFLEKLEANNFDILEPKVLAAGSDWKLPYRSYKAYKMRKF